MRSASTTTGKAAPPSAIRSGDVSALADYDQHARLHGGTYEQMTEQAARAYLADYLAGKDVSPDRV